MKKIIIILLLNIILVADVKFNNFNELRYSYISGSTDYESTHLKHNTDDFLTINRDNSSGSIISFDTFNDMSFNDITVKSDISYYNFDTSYEHSRNKFIQSDGYFELSELTFNYYNGSNTYTVGILPLKDGAFSEYAFLGNKKSDALFTLYNITTQGIFITHRHNNHKITLGYGERDMIDTGEYRYNDTKKNSDMVYIFFNNIISDKEKIVINYSHSNEILGANNPYTNKETISELGTSDLFGLGYSYDDRDTSGNLFYSIVGISHNDWDSTALSPIGVPFSNEAYHFGKSSHTGKSILLGYKYNFYNSFIKRESNFGAEIFKTEKYWMSFNSGQPYSAYGYGKLGTNYHIYTGIEITPQILVKLRYCESDIDYSKKYVSNEVYETDKTQKLIILNLTWLF